MVPLPTYSGRFTCPITSARVRTMPSTSAAARMAGSMSLTATAGPQACERYRERCLSSGAVRAERDGGNGRRRVRELENCALENCSHDASLLFFQVKSQLSARSSARQLAPHQPSRRGRRRVHFHILAMAAIAGRPQLLGVVPKLIDRGGLAGVVGHLRGSVGLAIEGLEVLPDRRRRRVSRRHRVQAWSAAGTGAEMPRALY